MNLNPNNEIDKILKKKLKAYGEGAPRRNPEAAKHTKDRFMAELDTLNLGATAPNPISSDLRLIFMGWVSGLKQQKENLVMSLKLRSTMTIISTILALFVFLFGGSGITAYAASTSLPGDALYQVKTGIENARASLAGNPEDQAKLFVGFAGKRLDEIRALIFEGRFANINATAMQFQKDIQKALDAIQKLAEKDPSRAAQLSADVAKILKGYSDSLSVLLAGAPRDVQPVIQDALNASQSAETENSNDINSNDNMNDNDANINDDQNGNGNNDNSNGNINDDNSHGNMNDNDTNINDDHGGNGNDDNGNANVNENANGNGSDDNGNANINDNANGNGSDDNGNANINENANGNTNINDNQNSNTNTNGSGGGGGGHGGGSSGGSSGGGSGSGGNGNDSGGGHGGGSKP